MKTIVADTKAVAFCGLYCGSCKAYLKEKCPGCAKNEKAGWCAIRTCCMAKGIQSCAECTEFANVRECKKFDNFVSKIFAVLFGSNRAACVAMIRDKGYEAFAKHMAEMKRHSLKR